MEEGEGEGQRGGWRVIVRRIERGMVRVKERRTVSYRGSENRHREGV